MSPKWGHPIQFKRPTGHYLRRMPLYSPSSRNTNWIMEKMTRRATVLKCVKVWHLWILSSWNNMGRGDRQRRRCSRRTRLGAFLPRMQTRDAAYGIIQMRWSPWNLETILRASIDSHAGRGSYRRRGPIYAVTLLINIVARLWAHSARRQVRFAMPIDHRVTSQARESRRERLAA